MFGYAKCLLDNGRKIWLTGFRVLSSAFQYGLNTAEAKTVLCHIGSNTTVCVIMCQSQGRQGWNVGGVRISYVLVFWWGKAS